MSHAGPRTAAPTGQGHPPGAAAIEIGSKDLSFWAEWASLVGLVLLVIVFQSAQPDIPVAAATSRRCWSRPRSSSS